MKIDKLLCRIFGHIWRDDAVITKTGYTQYCVFEYCAGVERKCLRCGLTKTELYYPHGLTHKNEGEAR